jgi:hypothetical protein
MRLPVANSFMMIGGGGLAAESGSAGAGAGTGFSGGLSSSGCDSAGAAKKFAETQDYNGVGFYGLSF